MKGRLIIGFLASSTLCAIGHAATRKVHTVAGAYLGDGKPAVSAALARPQYAATDTRGNIYVADQYHCRLRKINVHGVISTIAGTGICGFSGDGGPAKKAQIDFPSGVATDSHGNIYFVDYYNLRIRAINPSGVITTVAGNGDLGFSCGEGIPALQSCLAFPTAIAIEEGGSGENLYIADTLFDRVRKVSFATGLITTFAGNSQSGYGGDGGPATSASLRSPAGLAVYPQSHSVWISDTANNAIRRVDTNTGIITTLVGGSAFCDATLCFPMGISVDVSGGNVYVAVQRNHQILEVDAGSGITQIKAGSGQLGYSGDGGPAALAKLTLPQDVIVDNKGNLLIVDTGNNRVRRVDQSGTISSIVGGDVHDGATSVQSAVNAPIGLAFDKAGNLYFADMLNHRVRMVSTSGSITTIAGTGVTGYTGDGGSARQAELNTPTAVAVDALGNIFVYDSNNNAIRTISPGGTISTFAGVGQGEALAVDGAGNVYAGEICAIRKFFPNGNSMIVVGDEQSCGISPDGTPATQARISSPSGLAFDSNGNLYFAEGGNARVRMINPQGNLETVAGNGICGFSGDGGPATQAKLCPRAIGFDTKGNLYIADQARVRVVDKSGTIQTYAGKGGTVFNGNGLPALDTNMNPGSLAVSPRGVVYYSDFGTYLVRKIQ